MRSQAIIGALKLLTFAAAGTFLTACDGGDVGPLRTPALNDNAGERETPVGSGEERTPTPVSIGTKDPGGKLGLRTASGKILQEPDSQPFETISEGNVAERYPVKFSAEERHARVLRQNKRVADLKRGVPASVPSEAAPPTVTFSLPDLSTSFGASPLMLVVNRLGMPISTETLRELEARVSLRRWPSLERVPSNVRLAPSADEDANGYVSVTPQQPLAEDSWYALVVEKLPTTLEWPEFSPTLEDDSGRRIARFFVGERPVISSVRVCADRSVYLDFSERMRVENEGQFQFVKNGRTVACRFDGEAESSVLSAKFDCATEMKGFELRAGAKSQSGKDLSTRFSSLSKKALPWAENCELYRPDPAL
jgi:hypothetical protein